MESQPFLIRCWQLTKVITLIYLISSISGYAVPQQSESGSDEFCKTETDASGSDDSGNSFLTSRITYAFDPVTRKCYPVNGPDHTAPCTNGMKFFQRPDNPSFGFCDCDQDAPTIYSQATGKCYYLFRQEYCHKGEWLQVCQTGHLECKPDPCIAARQNSYEGQMSRPIVYFQEKCVQLGQSCGENDSNEIRLSDTFQPSCEPRLYFSIASFGGGLSIPTLKCSEGTRWSSLTESCKKTLTFDFS